VGDKSHASRIAAYLYASKIIPLVAAPVAAQTPTIKESSIVAQARPVPLELDGVAEATKDGGGTWRTCTGCHELNEGYDTGPYSETLKCHLGNGCSECGGIGAIWDTTDYGAMADAMMNGTAQAQPVVDQSLMAEDPLRSALAELVSIEDMKRRMAVIAATPGYLDSNELLIEYDHLSTSCNDRRQAAWNAARAALAQQPSTQDREDAVAVTAAHTQGYELGLRQRTSQDRDDAEGMEHPDFGRVFIWSGRGLR
jgi:hypothetical protein